MKLVVFDLDGTLAPPGMWMEAQDVQLLKQLEDRGYRIAICSGKPAYYLCGFMRQVGLSHPILVGENGAVIQFGVDLPPKEYYILPYPKEVKEVLNRMKNAIDEQYPDMWYQPNEVMFTPFPSRAEQFDWIQGYIDKNSNDMTELKVYRHHDCFDIVPKGISKKQGLAYLSKLLGVAAEEMIAVGDGPNDYPMFEYVGTSVGICLKDREKVDYSFDCITDALEFLNEWL